MLQIDLSRLLYLDTFVGVGIFPPCVKPYILVHTNRVGGLWTENFTTMQELSRAIEQAIIALGCLRIQHDHNDALHNKEE